MTQYVINIGALPNDGTGDPLRTAFNEVNLNFNQVWATGLIGSNIQIANNTILTSNTNGNLILNPNGIGSIIANAHVIPDQNRVRSLGSSSRYWDSIYVWYANVGGNLNISGGITVAGPATIDGNVLINGNLQVEGNVTFIDSNVVDIKDKNITLAYGSPNAQVANGGGITIAGANAQMYYNYSGNNWTFNLPIATANIQFPDGSVLDTANTVYIGQTPNDKGDGNLWFNSDDGRGYVKYNSQWIEFSPTVIPNPSVYLGNLTINGNNNSTLYFPPGGEIVFGDNTVQTTAWTGTANVDFTNISSNIIPSANITYSLGNATNQWKDLWVSNATIYINSVPLTIDGTTLQVDGANVVTTSNVGQANIGNLEINGALVQIAAGAPETYIDISSSGPEAWAYLQIPTDATANATNVRLHNDAGNIEIGSGDFSNSGPAYQWYFGKDGTLTIPGSISSNVGDGTGFESAVNGNTSGLYINGNKDGGGGSFLYATNNVTVRADNNGTPQDWAFDNTGGLTFPSGAGFVKGDTGQLKTNDANTTALDFRDSSGRGFYTNSDGYTLRSNGTYNWKFGTNGITTLPDNTQMGAVEGANTFGFYNSNDNTEFLIELGPTNVWDFNGASGNLTVPGNINYIGASPAPSINGFDTVNVANVIASFDISATGNISAHDITAGGNINGAGGFNVDGDSTIGGNLFVTGNINFSGNVTQITGNSGVFYGDAATGVGAIYAGKIGYTPLPNTVVQVTGDDNAYVQTNFQNTNHGNTASMEVAITADDGSDVSNYIDMGMASSTWDGTQDNSLGTAVQRRDGYLYVQGGAAGGNLILGTTTAGYSVKFNAGGPGSANTVAQITSGGILTTGVVSAAGNVRGSNLNTAGMVSAAGNVQGNYILGDGGLLSNIQVSGSNPVSTSGNVTGGNLLAVGAVSATGNITGNYFFGNAAFMTGIPASYGNSNVTSLLSNFGSNNISTTGNISVGQVTATANITTTGYFISGNQATGGFQLGNVNSRITVGGSNSYMTLGQNIALNPDTGASPNSGVLIGGNGYLLAPNGSRAITLGGDGSITITGNINQSVSATQAINTSGIISATGNITAGNVRTAGQISATGNITAGNVIATNIGNVAALNLNGNASTVLYGNGVFAAVAGGGNYGNSNVAAFMAVYGSNTISTSGNITAGNFIGNISVTGNVTGTSSNVQLVAGSYNWTFNNAGNLVLPGNTFAVNYANGTAVSLGGGGSYGDSNVVTLLSAFGSNTISTTGNITSGNIALTGNLTVNGSPIYGAPASYAKYTRSTTQTGAVANTVIVCNVSENTFGSDIAVNTGTGQVTLTAGRTYRLRGSIVGFSGAGTRPAVMWYNETGAAWIGESAEAYGASDAASNGSVGGTAEAVFTANSTTVVSFRILSVSSAITLGGNSDFSLNGSYPWIDIEVIGGQAPITGFSTTGNITGGNVLTTGVVSATANVTGGNILTVGLISATGNATAGNVTTAGLISATGNITGGNILTAGLISATGNITGGNIAGIFANGNSNISITQNANVIIATNGNATVLDVGADSRVRLGGLKTIGGNINAGEGYVQFSTSALTMFAGNIQLLAGGYIKGPGGINVIQLNSPENGSARILGNLAVGASNTGNIYGGLVSISGNVTGGNLLTAGQVSATGNVTGGNLILPGAGQITSTAGTNGNITINPDGTGLFVVTSITPAQFGNTLSVAGNVTVSGTGGVSQPNLPAFRVYGNGVTSVSTTTNTNGVLNGNNWAVDYNQGSYLNSTTGVFTAPIAGLYQVNLNMRVANNTAGSAQAIVIKNRGSTNTTQVMWESAANCTVNHFGVSTVSKLAANDTLTLVVAVGALTFDSNDSWSVAYLG